MIRNKHRSTAAIYLTSDVVATLLAFVAAWYLRFRVGAVRETLETSFGALADSPDFDRYLILLPIVLVAWPIVFYFHGLYQMRRGRSRVDEMSTVVLAVVLATLLLSVFTAWYRPPGAPRPDGTFEPFTYSRSFLALFGGLDLLLVGAGRESIRAALKRLRLSGRNLRRILIIGAGALGQEITRKLVDHRDLGFQVIGLLDDDPAKGSQSYHGAPVLGRVDDVQQVLDQHEIDQVFIALPLEAHRKMMRVLEIVGRECIEVRLVPDILQYATLKATLEDLDGTPVINLSQVPLQGWKSLAKRLMDIAIAAAALLVLLPFFPLVAYLIKREDGGPIFYRQERMGLDGKPFMILKFRSMKVGAESSTGPVWAIEDDPRRTRVGRWLRKWSLDELPQLWNVLKGEMSIIGPRPERPAFVQEFKHQIPQYMLRHRVKSGITGWAQVHGWRGTTSI
ncbi:MAG: undecaprenyl-phosphate glucose phosphotransferase, partial [Thermoanaerobaculia bacterium]|nr:undecaprenyl-phosphate glucose phosphotransferase [Thermoanaerobaculia bacterium]